MKIYLTIVIIFSSFLSAHSSTCTFPSDLVGTWESPAKGNVTFNDTHMSDYDIHTYTGLTFECHLKSGNYYVLRSDVFTLLGSGNRVNAAICMYPTKRSANKYTYFILTSELADAGNERVMFLQDTDVISTVDTVCDEKTVKDTPQETKLLIRYGEALQQRIQCPNPILGTFYYINHTSCWESYWDVCSNRKQMTFNYTLCSDQQGYSANATVDCMYSVSSGTDKVFYVYNEDSSVDDSTTYQYSCMVVGKKSGYVYVTQHPQDCYKNQTSEYVPSTGKSIILSANVTCVPSSASTAVSNAGLIAGIVVLLIIILGAVGAVVGYYIYTKKYKKVDVEKRRIDKENTVVSTDSRPLDAVTPSVVKAEMDTPRVGGSHGKLSQVLGPEYTMTNACDDTKAEEPIEVEELADPSPRKLPAIITGNTPRDALSPLDTQLKKPPLPQIN